MNGNELRRRLDVITIVVSVSLIVAKAVYFAVIVTKLIPWA
jgi:hypothetical protein